MGIRYPDVEVGRDRGLCGGFGDEVLFSGGKPVVDLGSAGGHGKDAKEMIYGLDVSGIMPSEVGVIERQRFANKQYHVIDPVGFLKRSESSV